MNQTVYNHYSPRFTNQPWANNHGQIIRLSFPAGSTRVASSTTGPNQWGAEKYLYPQALEDALGTIESRVAPIYQMLLANEKLNPIERLIWARWILCQFSRTPTHILELAGMEEDIWALFPDLASDFSSAETQVSINAAMNGILTFQDSDKLMPFIILRDWIVLRPALGDFFIKGDVPVVIRGALAKDNTVIIYPLSPCHCFVATVLGGFPPHQAQVEHRLRHGGTTAYNRLIAACASREVICHPDHNSEVLRSLVGNALAAHSRFTNLSKSGAYDE